MSNTHGWQSRAPAGRIAYVDGRYVSHGQAAVHIEDRGLQFADAVYEVFAIAGGGLCDEEEHLDRLERSLRELGIAMPMGRAPLKFVLREMVRRNRVRDGLLYLQATRGAIRRDHPVPSLGPRTTLILTARSMDMAGLATRWARCDIKSTSLLPNILAKTKARTAGAYEAWLVDRDGYVTEGSSTTAWIVDKDGRLVTRDLSNAILPGVTRRVILQAAAEAQIPITERRFTPDEASSAREAFLTAATVGVMPVITIDGRKVSEGVGALTHRVQELYAHATAKVAENRR